MRERCSWLPSKPDRHSCFQWRNNGMNNNKFFATHEPDFSESSFTPIVRKYYLKLKDTQSVGISSHINMKITHAVLGQDIRTWMFENHYPWVQLMTMCTCMYRTIFVLEQCKLSALICNQTHTYITHLGHVICALFHFTNWINCLPCSCYIYVLSGIQLIVQFYWVWSCFSGHNIFHN